jgi:hypothetical protein
MNNTIHVHFGGKKEVRSFELAEQETVGSLIQRLHKERHLGESKPEEWSVCVEDSDEELAHDDRLEHGKHKRIHVCRCKKVEVSVTFNGVTKSHPFRPGATLRKVIEWARDKFGVDKKEKLVLRLDSTESEPLDPDSHVGSYVHHPHCSVTFYLTPKVRIEG